MLGLIFYLSVCNFDNWVISINLFQILIENISTLSSLR